MWRTTTTLDPNGSAAEFNGTSDHGIDGIDGSSSTAVLAVQLSLLALCSAGGALANGLVFAVFYRRPSLRTISNR